MKRVLIVIKCRLSQCRAEEVDTSVCACPRGAFSQLTRREPDGPPYEDCLSILHE